MTMAFMGNGARKGDIQMGKEWVDKIIMEKLSEREKKVIILYKSGMTYEEIAKKLGCTQRNIGRILKKQMVYLLKEKGWIIRNTKQQI